MDQLTATCPVCGAGINVGDTVEVSELLTCSECHNRIVVESISNDRVALIVAPAIDEDWGE